MSKLLEKIIAILLVLVIAGANLSMSITYAVANIELGKQDAATQNSNVEFNSYFEEGGHETKVSLEEPAKLLVNIKVKNAGYLKSGVIQFENANFEISGEIKSDYIQSANKERIVLKQLNNGSDVTIEIPVSIVKGENISLDHFAKISNTKFAGTYVDGKGNEKSITKEIANQLSWKGEAKAEVTSEQNKYIPYQMGEKQGVMLQTRVKVGIQDGKLPIKKTNLEIQSPEINGRKPTEVTVVATNMKGTNGEENGQNFTSNNYVYEKETGKVTVTVENGKNNITWLNNVEDEYIVTYIYEGEEIYTEAKTNGIEAGAEVITGSIEVYNGEETKLEVEKVETEIKAKEEQGTIADIEIEGTKTIAKGQIYANYDVKKKKETAYELSYRVIVANSNLINRIELEQGIDTLVTKEGEEGLTTVEGKNYTYNKRISIKQEVFKKMLGEEGSIEIYADQTKIGTINKETEEVEGKYVLDISKADSNKVSIKTSKPITEGEFVIDIEKAIKEEIDYGKSQMQEFVQIKTKVEEKENEGIEARAEKTIELKEVVSQAELSISKADLTTVVKNEDVKIRATLNTASLSNALYKNPTIKITLPSYINQIDIKKTDILMANGLKIKKGPIVTTEKGSKVINIELEGKQEEYTIGAEYAGTIIELNTDLTVMALTPSNENKMTMEYTNENEVIENQKGKEEAKVKFVAPEGVVAANRISNFAEGKKDIMSISEKGGTATLDVYSPKRKVRISGTIINNYQNSINNVSILGRIPVKENKINGQEATFSTTLNKVVSVKGIKNAQVYYSDKADATVDITDRNNNWSKEATTNSKSYLIIAEEYEMKTGEGAEFSYEVEVPENLSHNHKVYETYEVHYNNLSSIGKMAEVQSSSVMEIATGQGPELTGEITPSIETVREGQIVKMKVKVTNSGTEVANNVKVNIPRPKYVSRFLEMRSIEMGFDRYEEATYTKTIGTIEAGKTAEITYYIQLEEAKKEIISEELSREVVNTATITADGLSGGIPTNECKLNLFHGDVRLEMNATSEEGRTLRKGEEIRYFIRVSRAAAVSEELKNIDITMELPEGLKYKKATFRKGEYAEEGETTEGITFNEQTNTITGKVMTLGAEDTVLMVEVEVEDYEGAISLIAKATVNGREHYSNIKEYQAQKINLKVSDLTVTPKYVKEGETLKYSVTLENNSTAHTSSIDIADILPQELEYEEAKYKIEESEFYLSTEVGENGNIGSLSIPAGEKVTIEIIARAKMLPSKQEKEVQNRLILTGNEIGTVQTNKVTSVIEYNEELRKELEEQEGGKPEEPDKTPRYKISGTAWIDANKDGKRDAEEERLAGIEVLLLNKATNTIVKDVDSKANKVTKTNAQGQYTFDNLERGEYLVVFAYDSANYSVTTYRAKDVDETLNSDAIDINMTLDGERRIAGVTDVISIISGNVRDIDIGVYAAQKFDLRLDKYINKITLTTPTIGTKVYNYNDSKAAKIEVLGSSLGKSNIVIEYKIVVTNEGAVPGYVKKIVDYLPEELGFNTELNKDWYLSDNGNLYNASLANTVIEPGQSKEVTLIVSKKITENSLGNPISNNAEIYESYNEQGLQDMDSKAGNKSPEEDDMSEAKVILSIVTGTIIKYTALILGVVTIFGFGIYEIKRRVIGKKKI